MGNSDPLQNRNPLTNCNKIYNVGQKNETLLLSVAWPNMNRFLKFFHHQTQEEICNKAIIKDSITPQMRRYTTL